MAETMITKWVLPEPVTIDKKLLDLFPHNPVFSEILYRRGFTSISKARAFLYPQEYPQSNPFDFPGMQDAVDIVLGNIENGSQIGICGDFDTDGLTATAILYEGLSKLTPHIHYEVPSRGRASHGISMDTIRSFHYLGIKLIITCDTGTSEFESIQYARSLGMKVIVTDHHTMPENPTKANVTINPELLSDSHPMRNLSGAGVAYKFIEAIYQNTLNLDELSQMADLAAIGIIGDMVSLTGENRFLCQTGIIAVQSTKRPGLIEILKNIDSSNSQINEKTISYGIGPRLNSLSRMVDGNIVVELLTTQDTSRAKDLAQLAEQANTNRKQMIDTILMAAQNAVEHDQSLLDKPLIFLEHDEWHYSALGLVASQLSERYRRPVIIVSSFDERISRGSARSIPGINITDMIAENTGLLEQFGGHAMAAGFSIKKENLIDFKRSLMTAISQKIRTDSIPEEVLSIDAILPLWDVTNPVFLDDFQLFRPFGPDNSMLNFLAEDLHFIGSVNFGKNMQHRRLDVTSRKLTRHSIIWWNSADQPLPPEQFDLVYQTGNAKVPSSREIQINLTAIRPRENTAAVLYSRLPIIQIIDWREKTVLDQQIIQQALSSKGIVFAEGIESVANDIQFSNRYMIKPCNELFLLTFPASYDILKEILQMSSPDRVYIIGFPAKVNEKNNFIKTVTEFILTAFRNNQGKVNIQELAAKTGQTEKSIRLAIDWLVQKTTLHIVDKDNEDIVLDRSGTPTKEIHSLLEDLEKSLEETAAFKRFFHKTDLQTLFMNIEMERKENIKS